MANRYVRPSGSDSNGGTSASDAWLTLGKALGASGAADGDVIWVGAGTYREQITVGMTSPTTTTRVVGDVDGAMTGDVGEVRVTGYDIDDHVLPSGSATTLDLAGRHFLQFEKISFYGGRNSTALFKGTNSHDITFVDCAGIQWSGSSFIVAITTAASVAANWTFDRCRFFGSAGFSISLTTSNFDYNVLFRNCFILTGGDTISLNGSGGGVDILGCTLIGLGSRTIYASVSTLSTVVPNTVRGCLIFTTGTALREATNGQIIEDNNIIYAPTPHFNVTPGANTVKDYAYSPIMRIGQEAAIGRRPEAFLSPGAGSGFQGFHDDAAVPGVDVLNRPRPAGAGSSNTSEDTGTATGTQSSTTLGDTTKSGSWVASAFKGQKVKITGGTGAGQIRYIQDNTTTALTVSPAWATTPVAASSTYEIVNPGKYKAAGYAETHDVADPSASGDADGGTGKAIKITGQGDVELEIAVDAAATALTVKVKWDSNHGDTNKPQAMLLANGEVGLTSDTTVTATGTAGSGYETLTFNFTPTAQGVVTLRLVSRATKGYGLCWFDTVGIA